MTSFHDRIGGGAGGTPPDDGCCCDIKNFPVGDDVQDGSFVYCQGTGSTGGQAEPTDNTQIPSSRTIGFFRGGKIHQCGPFDCDFVTDDGPPQPGDPVYLAGLKNDAGTGIGKLTPLPPSTPGQVIAEVGICLNSTAWGASKKSIIVYQPKAPILVT